jgi:hypothetical protein
MFLGWLVGRLGCALGGDGGYKWDHFWEGGSSFALHIGIDNLLSCLPCLRWDRLSQILRQLNRPPLSLSVSLFRMSQE